MRQTCKMGGSVCVYLGRMCEGDAENRMASVEKRKQMKKKKKDLREIESNFRTRSSFSCPGVSFPFSQQQSVGGERR